MRKLQALFVLLLVTGVSGCFVNATDPEDIESPIAWYTSGDYMLELAYAMGTYRTSDISQSIDKTGMTWNPVIASGKFERQGNRLCVEGNCQATRTSNAEVVDDRGGIFGAGQRLWQKENFTPTG